MHTYTYTHFQQWQGTLATKALQHVRGRGKTVILAEEANDASVCATHVHHELRQKDGDRTSVIHGGAVKPLDFQPSPWLLREHAHTDVRQSTAREHRHMQQGTSVGV